MKNRSTLRNNAAGMLPLAIALSACGTKEEESFTGLTLIGTYGDDK